MTQLPDTAPAHGARASVPDIPVLLPVKELATAKARLASVLTPSERAELVLAMLSDVLEAVASAGFRGYVVSPDPQVIASAAGAGANVLFERPSFGSLNRALEWATAEVEAGGAPVLVLLPDVPLVTAAELRSLTDEFALDERCGVSVSRSVVYSTVSSASATSATRGDRGEARMVAATDRAGRGTNALLVQPAGAVPMRFGRGSLARHLEGSASRGIPSRVCQLPGLAHDIDTPRDLAALVLAPGVTRTQILLRDRGIAGRLGHYLTTPSG